ncbi:tripartite tricarboxylate transporter TctB family protein [Hoeflea sp.]|uniref:tripartite tricarboxylate transporter TctB family protein n=1 Tax=Hoeflea sp. TaxID=1940281 RepID=UPI0019AC7A10|nr:tripartite tricarboxylate transporter TctB family protein [Hoeflea sp.]MBC7282380.1 tripartite tricarboxylate transporter TctB family protein [Hoeflea sp.]
MGSSGQRRVVIWGHLLLLCVIAAIILAYWLDARGTSLKTNNLLLVQPGAILGLVLVALVLPQVFRKVSVEEVPDATARRQDLLNVGRVALLAGAFGLFVFSLETIGFDIATFVFVAAGLYLCGEKKLWVIGVYSAIFTVLVVYGYQALVPYPFPLTVL